MTQKCALIVDDSRTARQALGDVLAANRMRVEMAVSAEEALDYLSRSRPDVIFMDHMMPGMDGLQAVKSIKANPATATIPIMMYTSQEGELYVGQARALGAVGVLPKQIKPVEVSELLRTLHLVGEYAAPPAPPQLPLESAPYVERRRDVNAALNSRDWTDMHRWLQEMFEHHGQELRSDIEATVARVLREQAAPLPAPESARSPFGTAAIVALSLLAGLFFWLQLDTQRKWRAVVEQNASLMATLTSRRENAAAPATETARLLDTERDEVSGRLAEFVAALEWGMNQAAVYPPGAPPFGNERMQSLRGLLERLEMLGFTGTVRFESHVGDFCYVQGPENSLLMAPDDLAAERCSPIGLDADAARAASAVETIAFAAFLGSRSADAAVRVEIQARGNLQPAAPYPSSLTGLTAGEWNQVARQNNRVNVTLIPDNPR